mmetsp:Transcript_58634/g.174539  ORF Transcript_58634/g.174539 Transcript_58634/m.174539 type:complete len:216 (-) Transcript_58634:235-882(-)
MEGSAIDSIHGRVQGQGDAGGVVRRGHAHVRPKSERAVRLGFHIGILVDHRGIDVVAGHSPLPSVQRSDDLLRAQGRSGHRRFVHDAPQHRRQPGRHLAGVVHHVLRRSIHDTPDVRRRPRHRRRGVLRRKGRVLPPPGGTQPVGDTVDRDHGIPRPKIGGIARRRLEDSHRGGRDRAVGGGHGWGGRQRQRQWRGGRRVVGRKRGGERRRPRRR